MKPTREEILNLAERQYRQAFDWYAFDANEIEAFFLAAYKMGQAEMRDKAANWNDCRWRNW